MSSQRFRGQYRCGENSFSVEFVLFPLLCLNINVVINYRIPYWLLVSIIKIRDIDRIRLIIIINIILPLLHLLLLRIHIPPLPPQHDPHHHNQLIFIFITFIIMMTTLYATAITISNIIYLLPHLIITISRSNSKHMQQQPHQHHNFNSKRDTNSYYKV